MKNMHLKINKNFLPLFIVIMTLLVSACTQRFEKEAVVPENLIPQETMVDIFVDLRLLDATVNLEQKKRNRKTNDLSYHLHNSIMDKYVISREQFEASFHYYQNDLEILDEIYMDAITKLSKMKSAIDQE